MGTKVHLSVGGTVIREDIRCLRKGPHVVVGTPGRVHDMMKKGHLKTDYLKLFIMDEADEMLNSDFKVQIQDIFKFLPHDVQIGLFSATLPPSVLRLTKAFMREPAKILVKAENLTLEGIHQYYIPIERHEWKMEILVNLYSNLDIQSAIIYCNTKKRVEELERLMSE